MEQVFDFSVLLSTSIVMVNWLYSHVIAFSPGWLAVCLHLEVMMGHFLFEILDCSRYSTSSP